MPCKDGKELLNLIREVDILIWGREFSLQVDYDCYTGESVTDEQAKTLEHFLSRKDRKDLMDIAKTAVEEYCKEQVAEDIDNTKKDNVFSYVKPESIYVTRDDPGPKVAIMCAYRYDPEHGLAVVFSPDDTVSVDVQDIVL